MTRTLGPPVDDTIESSLTLTEDATLEMPLSYGAGIAWRVSDALTIDADVYRTHWSDCVLFGVADLSLHLRAPAKHKSLFC